MRLGEEIPGGRGRFLIKGSWSAEVWGSLAQNVKLPEGDIWIDKVYACSYELYLTNRYGSPDSGDPSWNRF